jgi:hypothetical protein
MMTKDEHAATVFHHRWSLTHTIKGGWRPDGMSVSATYEEGKEPSEETMTALARKCMDEAHAAANEANATFGTNI